MSSECTLFFAGLCDREKQLTGWLDHQRPPSYWLTGFYNPQGFLTAAKQEITRRHPYLARQAGESSKEDSKWSLDNVSLITEVTDYLVTNIGKIGRSKDENKLDGVYIHGLFLEGCSWDRKDNKVFLLRDTNPVNPRELYTAMPVLFIRAETNDVVKTYYTSGPQKEYNWYQCPVYTRPKRSDQSLIKHFKIALRSHRADPPEKWVLRGVALLCSRE